MVVVGGVASTTAASLLLLFAADDAITGTGVGAATTLTGDDRAIVVIFSNVGDC